MQRFLREIFDFISVSYYGFAWQLNYWPSSYLAVTNASLSPSQLPSSVPINLISSWQSSSERAMVPQIFMWIRDFSLISSSCNNMCSTTAQSRTPISDAPCFTPNAEKMVFQLRNANHWLQSSRLTCTSASCNSGKSARRCTHLAGLSFGIIRSYLSR